MGKSIENTSRYLAMEILDKIERKQSYSNLELNHQLDQGSLDFQDRALASRLVYGVLQRKLSLDYYLSDFISPSKKIDSWVRQLLRLSAYQAIYLDRIPDHAIIDEAVKIAKKKGHAGVGKFVNAVLRNLQRQELKDINDIQDPLRRLAVSYSIPQEMMKLIIDDYGLEKAQSIGQSFLDQPYASARVNLKYLTQDQAIENLRNEGFDVQASPLTTWGIRAKTGQWTQSSLFDQGYLTVQDESSMLVAEAMDIHPSHQVLDACAGPGGKTSHIANYLDPSQGGSLLACDIHQHKLTLVQDNCVRQGFESLVSYKEMDARQASQTLHGQSFDRILCDAPCSGFGLLRRKAEIKYSKSLSDVKKLSHVQTDILDGLAPLLKSNGILLYSSCTLFKMENDQVVETFLNRHPNFKMGQITFNHPTQGRIRIDGPLQLLPQDYGTDGFFICALEKI